LSLEITHVTPKAMTYGDQAQAWGRRDHGAGHRHRPELNHILPSPTGRHPGTGTAANVAQAVNDLPTSKRPAGTNSWARFGVATLSCPFAGFVVRSFCP
jgi:hypothetical protein